MRYFQVADELVAEFADPSSSLASPDQQQYDEKNIRRRVYDALNVLMAMDIISKDKKEIQWKGLPHASLNDIEDLKAERIRLRTRIDKKAAYLQELEEQRDCLLVTHGCRFASSRMDDLGSRQVEQMVRVLADGVLTFCDGFGQQKFAKLGLGVTFVGLQNLIKRNEQLYSAGNAPAGGVTLPFILVQTRPHATVEVEISEDMQLVHFDFNSTPFELHDDAYVLKAMRFCERQGDGAHDPANGSESNANMLSMYQQHVAHPPKSSATGKQPVSPPVPGILKARVKHEH
ncbi:hypothetical protein ACLOJK_017091 [Asimina triloba]